MFYRLVWVQGTLFVTKLGSGGVYASICCRNGKCNWFYSASPTCFHVWHIGTGEILPGDVYENSLS